MLMFLFVYAFSFQFCFLQIFFFEVWNSKSPETGPIDVQIILGEKLF